MSIIGSNILAGASGQGGGYTIENSLRFRSSASAYLSRTPASAGNRKTWTWSAWVKRGSLSQGMLFDAGEAVTPFLTRLYFVSDNTLRFQNYQSGTNIDRVTTQVFRDVSAYYHIMCVGDTTQSISSDRLKLYVNGVQVTAFNTNSTSISQNADMAAINNSSYPFNIGRGVAGGDYFDGYMTEVNFIDGQALDPSSFGEYNEDTGVWQPVAYSGSYGTNGFYLPFSDNTTTTTLAADASGNGNDWTPNNISLTSGATYDSMTDTPTPYANGGNYCVLNSLNQNSAITLSAGNLSFTASNNRFTTGTFAVTSGKWYLEFYPAAGGASGVGVGAILATTYVFGTAGFANGAGYTGVGYTSNGSKYVSGTSSAYGATYGSGNVIGVALDLDSGTKTITFYKDNTSQGSINLPTSSESWIVATDYSEAGTHSINFGQRPFAYTPPTGFLPLHTGNLPDSAIVDGSKYFNAVLYTGNTSGASVTGVGFQPDFVWVKNRDVSNNHELIDAVRGGSSALFSNVTNQAATQQRISSFDSDGWTYTTNSNSALANPYVGWTWKESATAGFDIVTFTSTVAPQTVSHNLGVAPSMIILKNTAVADAWFVYHKSLGETKGIYLHLPNGSSTVTWWNNTAPTSSVFSVNMGNAYSQVAYCFAEVEGYSKFGSYTGNGSVTGDGPFVYTGFRPAFVMVKRTDSSGSWQIKDTARNTSNLADLTLFPNLPNSEYNLFYFYDLLSNGFKVRGSDAELNASGGTYIYMAFAESPFKVSLAR